MKRLLVFILAVAIIFSFNATCFAQMATKSGAEDFTNTDADLNLDVKSAVLMEAVTGEVLYEINKDEALPPASVTKIMTLLLVAEAIADGKISHEDKELVSDNAASMAGSQVFLEAGEEMTVEELLKCTVIASANDAAVALAEHTAGSESAFVSRMNERRDELGLKSTTFENTTGLDDSTTAHLTSAYDIALMSRELIKHDCVMKYSSLWQDTIRDGEFTLTNTNRLVRYYSGCTGLKTGSTDKAGFCVSATAERDGVSLIAVVMGADSRESRNNAARAVLDYGFANYTLYSDSEGPLENIPVLRGVKDSTLAYSSGFSCLLGKGDDKRVEKHYDIPESIYAPIEIGEKIGEIVYTLDGEEIGRADITVAEDISAISVFELFMRIISNIIFGKII